MDQQSVTINTVTASSAKGAKTASAQSNDQEKQEIKPFSSTLNEQLESTQKLNGQQKSESNSTDTKATDSDKLTEEDSDVDSKTPPSDNILSSDDDSESIDVDAGNESAELIENIDVSVVGVQPLSQSQVTKDIQQEPAESAAKTAKGQTVVNTVKTQPKNDQNTVVSEDAKQQNTAVLRSDILHALRQQSTQTTDETKLSPLAEKGVATEVGQQQQKMLKPSPFSLDGQLTEDQKLAKLVQSAQQGQLTDGQKMARLLSQVKVDTSARNQLRDRGVGEFSATTSSIATTALTASSAVQSTSPASTVLAMQPSVQSAAWGKVLSSRVVWMAKQGIQEAQLKLNPANMGPVDVKMQMSNEQVSITFIAQQAPTREALEQALPKLRESFQENGMELAYADVSEQQQQQDDSQQEEDGTSTMHQQDLVQNDAEEQIQDDSVTTTELELGVSVFA